MTLFTPEQFVAMQKSNLDAAFTLVNSVAEGLERLVNLNLQLSKSMLASTQAALLQGLAAQPGAEPGVPPTALAAKLPEQAQTYGRQLADLASATVAEFVRVGEGQSEAYQRRVQAMIDDVAKNAPSGSEAAIAAWKSAVNTSNTLFDTLRKSYEQAARATESSLAAISSAANPGRGASK
jgi:phasin family protein